MLSIPIHAQMILLGVLFPDVEQYLMAEVVDVHGQHVVLFVVSEMLVENVDHEEVHVHHRNCLCFIPIQLYPYFRCFFEIFDYHVSQGFALIGCLKSDQEEKTLDQIQKPFQFVYELVDFCS